MENWSEIGLFLVILIVVSISLGCQSKFEPIDVKSVTELGSVSEQICDMEIWKDELWIAPYLGYKPLKLYSYNLRANDGIKVAYSASKTVESIYRVWTDASGNRFNFSTEQPPMWYLREVSSNWGCGETYASKGWALLGDTLNNNVEVRGWSYNNRHPIIKYAGNGWINFPELRGNNNKFRIVWAMEYYGGKYYACTSPGDAYSSENIGNVYRLDGNTWVPVLGFDAGRAMGGAVCACVGDGRLFIGTYRPQAIWWCNQNEWKVQQFDANWEISKIWHDDAGRVFAGGVKADKVVLYQYDYTEDEFVEVWSKPATASPKQWCTIGVAWKGNDGIMFLKYWDANKTRVVKITYE